MKKSSCPMHWDVNNMYGQAMPEKSPLTSHFNISLKNYNENSNI